MKCKFRVRPLEKMFVWSHQHVLHDLIVSEYNIQDYHNALRVEYTIYIKRISLQITKWRRGKCG